MSLDESVDRNAKEKRYLEAKERAKRYTASLAGPSLIERLAALDEPARARVLSKFSTSELARLAHHWPAWSRPAQSPPHADPSSELAEALHRVVFFCCGRGFGKTKSAAERVKERVYAGAKSILLVGPTDPEIVKYMLGKEGDDDGLLNIFHPSHRPVYVGKPHNVVRFHTGAVGYLQSAETPEARGGNFDTVWGDEIAKWRYLRALWANILLATRKRSAVPIELIVTGTPLPLAFLKELIADEETLTIFGSGRENPWNDPGWIPAMVRAMGGTRLGAQEIEGEILGDNPDAFFFATILDEHRILTGEPHGLRNALSIDPAIATNPDNDLTGMVLGGDDTEGHCYVLDDFTGRHKPEVWGKIAVDVYEQRQCEAIVGERNRGGDLVESNVRAAMQRKRGGIAAEALKFVNVNARKGKHIRAEPVSALHVRGFLHMVGTLPEFETEITEWNPKLGGKSPNRLDALVQLVGYLGGLFDEEAEAAPDHRKTFKGIGGVNARLAAPSSAATGARVATAGIRRGAWGSKI